MYHQIIITNRATNASRLLIHIVFRVTRQEEHDRCVLEVFVRLPLIRIQIMATFQDLKYGPSKSE